MTIFDRDGHHFTAKILSHIKDHNMICSENYTNDKMWTLLTALVHEAVINDKLTYIFTKNR